MNNACKLLHSYVLGSSRFARRYFGNHYVYFLFLRVIRWFSSPRALLLRDDTALPVPGCPIRVPPGLRMCAPRRRLSQLTAPFFAALRQGIRRLPLLFFQFIIPFSYRSTPVRDGFLSMLCCSIFCFVTLYLFFLSSYVNEHALIGGVMKGRIYTV